MFQQPTSQLTALFNAPIAGSSVRLFVFTPRIHGAVCLRPSVYNFNEGTIEELHRGPTYKQSCAKYDNNTPNLTRAIVPDPHGVRMNTSMLDSMWSFILVMEDNKASMSYRTYGAPSQRTVLTGYFVDEPIAPMTLYSSSPIMNDRAVMLFTHRSSAIITHSLSRNSKTSISMSANHDYAPQAFALHAEQGDLALVDVSHIVAAQAVSSDGSYITTDANSTLLKTHHANAPIIPSYAKTPRQQMMAIAGAADSAKEMVDAPELFGTLRSDDSMLGGDFLTSEFDKFISAFRMNLTAPSADISLDGVDSSRAMPLAVLMSTFPRLEVYPLKIPVTPQFEVGNQADISIINTMSSLVQSSIAVYATELGLSSIAFRYESYIRPEMAATPGLWELFRVTPFLGGDAGSEQTVSNQLHNFRTRVEADLFPILRAFSGEFSLFVDFDMVSSTVIDLQYMDCPEQHGLYEAHNRLGGIISPAIGNCNHLEHNHNAIAALTTQLTSMSVGRISQFGLNEFANHANSY